jgi:hypothetical protein
MPLADLIDDALDSHEQEQTRAFILNWQYRLFGSALSTKISV